MRGTLEKYGKASQMGSSLPRCLLRSRMRRRFGPFFSPPPPRRKRGRKLRRKVQAGGKHDLMKKLFNPGKEGKRSFDFLLPTSFFGMPFLAPSHKRYKSPFGERRGEKKQTQLRGSVRQEKSGRAPSSPGASKNRRTFAESFAFARRKKTLLQRSATTFKE